MRLLISCNGSLLIYIHTVFEVMFLMSPSLSVFSLVPFPLTPPPPLPRSSRFPYAIHPSLSLAANLCIKSKIAKKKKWKFFACFATKPRFYSFHILAPIICIGELAHCACSAFPLVLFPLLFLLLPFALDYTIDDRYESKKNILPHPMIYRSNLTCFLYYFRKSFSSISKSICL